MHQYVLSVYDVLGYLCIHNEAMCLFMISMAISMVLCVDTHVLPTDGGGGGQLPTVDSVSSVCSLETCNYVHIHVHVINV